MMSACIRAENRKLRGSAVWPVFFALPLISAAYGTFNYLMNQGILSNSWYDLYTQHTLFYALFFFSSMVGIYCAYLWRLEHKGHNWNLIMTAPVKPIYLFLAKEVVVLKMALLTQLWVFVLYVVCGKLFAGLPGWPPVQLIFWMMRGTLAAVQIVALQLLLSMVIRSFAVPVFIALFGSVTGMLVGQKYGMFWPYALMMMGMNANKTEDMLAGGAAGFVFSCVLFTLLFTALAALVLKKRDVRA